jgi:outer membrane protein assembly factor BamB
VNLNNGTIAWAYDAGGVVHMSQPAIEPNPSAPDAGTLYVGVMGVYDGDISYGPPYGLLSLSLNGTFRWFAPTSGPVASSPVLAGTRVFVADRAKSLYGFRTADGTVAWNVSIGGGTSSPSYRNGIVYVGGAGTLGLGSVFAVTSAGTELWEAILDGPIQASIVTDGRLVCSATNQAQGYHFCLRPGFTIDVAWKRTPSPAQYILGSPVVVGNTMYAVSDNGHVYAYRDGDPAAYPLLRVSVSPSPLAWDRPTSLFVDAFSEDRGMADSLQLEVDFPVGLRLTNETEVQAQVARTYSYGLGSMYESRLTRQFQVIPLAGYATSTIRARLTYDDLAGHPYPPAEASAMATAPPLPPGPGPDLRAVGLAVAGVAVVVAVAHAAVAVRRRKRSGG